MVVAHAPAPSHPAGSDSTPAVHCALEAHVVVEPGKWQLDTSEPLHELWLHDASALALLAHAARPAVGAPAVAEQCPALPGLAHDWQGLLGSQALSQQTPSTQCPELHCASVRHAPPRSPMQSPVAIWQIWPAGHDAVLQQTDTPAPAETQWALAQAASLAQLCPGRAAHVPLALQVLVSTGQLSTSSPFTTGVQAPSAPATLHAWQVAQVGWSQQTPSVQIPVSHPDAHELPRVCISQVSKKCALSSPPPVNTRRER